MPNSPTAEGFRAAFRRPSLTLAEIVWRWTAGATAAALILFGLFEYLDTLPVTNGELLFLRTRQPYLVGEAIAHIFRGSLNRVVIAGLLAALLLAVLWVVAASVGRIATVRGLLDYFRRDLAGEVPNKRRPLPALLRLSFLRVAVAAAAIFGLAGAAILAGFASPDANPSPWFAFFLFLPLAGLVCLAWWSLNWLLSLAGVFAVRDDVDALGAISAAATFCRERTGPVFAVTAWTGLAHLVAFVAASVVASMPLGFVAVVPWRLVVAGVMLVSLAYYAIADWLYMVRLAGYVYIVETPQTVLTPPVPSAPPPIVRPPAQTVSVTVPLETAPLETTIDREEAILSDVPDPAVEP
jgi:hypothetical protein